MSLDALKQNMEKIIIPLLQKHQFDLVDLQVKQQGGKVSIELLADNPTGGINLDDCAFLNKKICDTIEDSGMMTHSYVVAVSSPGLDRPLKTLKDFLRVRERKVRVIMDEPVVNRHEWVGVVKKATQDQLTIKYKHQEGNKKSPSVVEEEIQLPLNKIKKAMQII